MDNKTTIEEEVSKLSQEQQDKIIKAGKIALTLQLIVLIPWIATMLLGVWTIINPPVGFDYSNYDKLYLGLLILLGIGAACIIGIFLFVKIKYPYYSDAKWRYINKMRKGK